MPGPAPSERPPTCRRSEGHCETRAMLPGISSRLDKLRPCERVQPWLFQDSCSPPVKGQLPGAHRGGLSNKGLRGTRYSSFLSVYRASWGANLIGWSLKTSQRAKLRSFKDSTKTRNIQFCPASGKSSLPGAQASTPALVNHERLFSTSRRGRLRSQHHA